MAKKFFWLHIPKCGGQSMRRALKGIYVNTKRKKPAHFNDLPKEQWNDALNNYRVGLGKYDYKRMLYAKKFLYTKKEFDSMFKFTIVRNPYSRAFSNWKYHCSYPTLLLNRKYQSPIPSWWFLMQYINKKKSFEMFLAAVKKNLETKKNYHMATHTAPMLPDITDEKGKLLVDFVGRLENIGDDFAFIAKKIGIGKKKFPKVNVTKRRGGYEDYYTEKSRKIVEDIYKEDIKFFGYKFGE